MQQNKLSKQSYFIKRLRDSGYVVERIPQAIYSKADPRLWTILINPRGASLMCTCYTNNGEAEGVDPAAKIFLEVFDGGQYIPGRLKIDTNSVEVFITYLVQYGIEPAKESTPNRYAPTNTYKATNTPNNRNHQAKR